MIWFTRTIIVLGLTAMVPAAAAEPSLATEQDKTIYAIGLAVAQSLGRYNITAEELATVQDGIADGVLGNEPKVDLQVYGPKIQQFGQDRMMAAARGERDAAAGFLEEMAKEKGAIRTDSGLIYIEMTPGSGDSPAATDTVEVHYHGTLRDGSVFDSSVDRGTPAKFGLNRVIKCWTEGVAMMKVGGKSKLVCPADIAYGDRGAPPKILPGAALSFEVELLSVEKAATPTPTS